MIPKGAFPQLLKLGPNKEYVRDVIKASIQFTSLKEDYLDVSKMPKDADFFKFQESLNHDVHAVPSHRVIVDHIEKFGEDYRYADKEHQIKSMQDRKSDNTWMGRRPE